METSGFQQAIKTATVTYPIPFLIGIILLFSLFCCGVAVATADPMRWVAAAMAVVAMIFAFGAMVYTVIARPELLRSESHVQMMTVINILGDKDMDATQRQQVSLALLEVLGERTTKRAATSSRGRKEISDG